MGSAIGPSKLAEQRERRAFLSYSWDSPAHTEWVERLVKRLENDGVFVVWDRQVQPGADLALFMEQLSDSDCVLVVCTPAYKEKADKRLGGVGYETRLMVAKLIRDQKGFRAVALLRDGDWPKSGPLWTGSAFYLDFRGEPYSETEYNRLRSYFRGSPPPAVPVPPPPKVQMFVRYSHFLTIGFVFTLLGPMLVPRHMALIETEVERAALSRYLWLTGVRGLLGIVLIAAAVLGAFSLYRTGIPLLRIVRRSHAASGFGLLVLCTCLSSMLNLSLLDFNGRVDAAPLVLPEILSYVYLIAGLCVLAQAVPMVAENLRKA